MRKSHSQKVADRKAKRRDRGRQRFYDGLVAKFTRQLKEIQDPHQFPRADLYITQRKLSPVYIEDIFEEKSRAYAKDAAEKAFIGPIINAVPDYEVIGVDPGKAGQDFISALFSAVKADLPAMILSSTESMKPCLLERVLDCLERDWRRRHKINTNPSAEPTKKVCPNCEGTGWAYHEHLPIERHVGCEDCGGCGDERGTGIIP